MKENRKPEIPPHTKWGIRVSAIIILLISVMIIKNCVGSFMYGTSTNKEMQEQYYNLGYTHGRQKAQDIKKQTEPEIENLLLKKLYRKGYRDGWDSARQGTSEISPPEPAGTEQ